MYNSPNDWALWIGGQKITAHKNDTDVAVVNVSPDVATFSWQPSYKDAISRRLTADNFAPIDPVKNKIAAIQSIRQDENGMVTFSLRQNQTFAVGYFKTFEGYVDSPKLEPISNANTSSANAMTTMINEVAGSIGALGSAPKPNVPNISNFINRLEGPTKALTAPSRPNPNTAPPG